MITYKESVHRSTHTELFNVKSGDKSCGVCNVVPLETSTYPIQNVDWAKRAFKHGYIDSTNRENLIHHLHSKHVSLSDEIRRW